MRKDMTQRRKRQNEMQFGFCFHSYFLRVKFLVGQRQNTISLFPWEQCCLSTSQFYFILFLHVRCCQIWKAWGEISAPGSEGGSQWMCALRRWKASAAVSPTFSFGTLQSWHTCYITYLQADLRHFMNKDGIWSIATIVYINMKHLLWK